MADEVALSPDTSTEVVGRGSDQPMTDDEAAESLNKLFAPEPKKRELPPKGPDGKFLKKDAPIPLTPADGSDDPDEDLEQKPETDEAEEKPKAKAKEAEPEDDDEPEEAPAPRLVKVKVDGMELDVDEEELKKGYSRTSDYTRKTQALAEERKKFESEERAQVRQLAAEFKAKMEAVEEALQDLNPQEPDWNTLRQTMQPDEFTAAFAEWHTHSKRLEKVRGERERVRAFEEQESARDRQTRLAAEMEKLQDALPDLKDPEKGKVLRNDLTAYANSVGFSDDDLAGVEDHRALVLLDKARRWDEYQRNKPKLEAKVDRALATAVKPGSATPKPSAKKLDVLQTTFNKTRSADDAAEFLNHLLAPPRKAG